MGVSLVALRCRTSDRTPLAGRGVETLAPLIGGRLGMEARAIGSPSEARAAPYEEDLRDSRGCLLEAGGQVDDALDGRAGAGAAGGRVLDRHHHPARRAAAPARASRCSGWTPTPTTTRPATTASGYLGGMSLAGACGEWDAGLGGHDPVDRVVLAGVRDIDAGERDLLGAGGVTVMGASSVETLVAVKNALDGAPVYVHLDLDVIDPEHFPAQFPAPGGLHPEKLYDLAEAVVRGLRARGPRDHGVRGAGRPGGARRGRGDRHARGRALP